MNTTEIDEKLTASLSEVTRRRLVGMENKIAARNEADGYTLISLYQDTLGMIEAVFRVEGGQATFKGVRFTKIAGCEEDGECN